MSSEPPIPAVETLKVGLLIAGRCRLEAYVNKGGQGVIWRARDEKYDGAICALKFLLPE
jgi:hypothetical protein